MRESVDLRPICFIRYALNFVQQQWYTTHFIQWIFFRVNPVDFFVVVVVWNEKTIWINFFFCYYFPKMVKLYHIYGQLVHFFHSFFCFVSFESFDSVRVIETTHQLWFVMNNKISILIDIYEWLLWKQKKTIMVNDLYSIMISW